MCGTANATVVGRPSPVVSAAATADGRMPALSAACSVDEEIAAGRGCSGTKRCREPIGSNGPRHQRRRVVGHEALGPSCRDRPRAVARGRRPRRRTSGDRGEQGSVKWHGESILYLAMRTAALVAESLSLLRLRRERERSRPRSLRSRASASARPLVRRETGRGSGSIGLFRECRGGHRSAPGQPDKGARGCPAASQVLQRVVKGGVWRTTTPTPLEPIFAISPPPIGALAALESKCDLCGPARRSSVPTGGRDGMYKSVDAGRRQHLGLRDTQQIEQGRTIEDCGCCRGPRHSERAHTERGIFRLVDGGKSSSAAIQDENTWRDVLRVPSKPNIVYASLGRRGRDPEKRRLQGSEQRLSSPATVADLAQLRGVTNGAPIASAASASACAKQPLAAVRHLEARSSGVSARMIGEKDARNSDPRVLGAIRSSDVAAPDHPISSSSNHRTGSPRRRRTFAAIRGGGRR